MLAIITFRYTNEKDNVIKNLMIYGHILNISELIYSTIVIRSFKV